MNKKTVVLAIEVPEGPYCWNHHKQTPPCGFFDNEGGWPKCRLSLGEQKENYFGVLKASDCANLPREGE